MKVFVWKYIEECSDRYHPEGGIVVFAEDEQAARLLAKEKGANIQEKELPDDVREVGGGEPACYIFEDAGCC